MEYTIQYEVEYRHGEPDAHVETLYPSTVYNKNRPGGPVGHTRNVSGYWAPYTWKTEKGARQNIRKYEPSGDIVSATVVGLTNVLDGKYTRKVTQIDNLAQSRIECGLKLEEKRAWWEARRAEWRAESAKLKEKRDELQQLLDETGIEGYDLEGYAHGDDPVGVWIPYEQAIKLLYMVNTP